MPLLALAAPRLLIGYDLAVEMGVVALVGVAA